MKIQRVDIEFDSTLGDTLVSSSPGEKQKDKQINALENEAKRNETKCI